MEESVICSKCRTPLGEDDKFCGNCGYPERGDTQERYEFNYNIKVKEDAIAEARKKLKNVKILLYVIAGINFLVGIYYLTNEATFIEAVASFIAAVIFVGFVFWVNKQPLTGILAAFIFWIVLQLSVVLDDPTMLMKGWLFKIIVIVIFVKGISSAREARKYTEQLKEMKA